MLLPLCVCVSITHFYHSRELSILFFLLAMASRPGVSLLGLCIETCDDTQKVGRVCLVNFFPSLFIGPKKVFASKLSPRRGRDSPQFHNVYALR